MSEHVLIDLESNRYEINNCTLDTITAATWNHLPNGKMRLFVGRRLVSEVKCNEWFFHDLKELLIAPMRMTSVRIEIDHQNEWPILILHGRRCCPRPRTYLEWFHVCPEWQLVYQNADTPILWVEIEGYHLRILGGIGLGTVDFRPADEARAFYV